MQTYLRTFGNSKGIYIPKNVMEMLEWTADEALSLEIKDDALVIKKENQSKTLRERFEEYYAKPFGEISDEDIPKGEEIDWGVDVGGELL